MKNLKNLWWLPAIVFCGLDIMIMVTRTQFDPTRIIILFWALTITAICLAMSAKIRKETGWLMTMTALYVLILLGMWEFSISVWWSLLPAIFFYGITLPRSGAKVLPVLIALAVLAGTIKISTEGEGKIVMVGTTIVSR